ncbi:MAG: MBOAT family protein [Lewinellaceae bacterium]|nr:MBOAT family protein [Lewinellaceae bacterium]
MLFTSLVYFLFLPIVAAVFFLTPVKWRWLWLLAASYFFYMYWNPAYIVLIVASTLIDYWAALQIGRQASDRRKRPYLYASLAVNLGLLFAFKYFNFFSDQMTAIARPFWPGLESFHLHFLLPVGISFYTFQTLAYTIDVYRGYLKPEPHLGKFALYVSFFPQLVAGPIERARDLLTQFHFESRFDYARVVGGLQLILWGLFKKLVIADRLGLFVDRVYGNYARFEGIPIWVATIFFLFQIFCDFSAYQDIAMGSAKIIGVKLSKNFDNRVYVITSFSRFWREWHITLTSWFRDYVYFPLSGLSKKRQWLLFALFLIFALNGIWHGANWTFVIWGALNGLFVVGENLLKKPVANAYAALGLQDARRLKLMMGFIVCFVLGNLSIIFFRAESLHHAGALIKHGFNLNFRQFGYLKRAIGAFDLYLSIALVIVMDILHVLMKGGAMDTFLSGKKPWLRWAFYLALFAGILFLGIPAQRKFIYFEF